MANSNPEKFLEKNPSIDELDNLSYCEHTLLRAVATRALLQRDSTNQNKRWMKSGNRYADPRFIDWNSYE